MTRNPEATDGEGLFCDDASRCHACEGDRYLPPSSDHRHERRVCPHCGGSGRDQKAVG